MTNGNPSQSHEAAASDPAPRTTELTLDDPRYGLAVVTIAVRDLITAAEAGGPPAIARSTPCTDFTVKELLEHLVLVMRRVGAIGNGEHWSSVDQVPTDDGWGDDFAAAAHAVRLAWDDPSKLAASYEVPWGVLPGAPLLLTYTAELATHAWDLATALDRPLAIDDDVLAGALVAAKMLPADGRGADVPFGPVVDPGPEAPALLQIAGWMGRRVVG